MVPNKFPALGIEGNLNRQAEGMFDKMNGIGAHEVIIETPDHNATLATLAAKRIEDVLWAFRDRILDLKKDRRFKYILIFKNHGEAAGASLEHPHSQLIALPIVPNHVVEELEGAKQYYIYKERCVFCDIIRQEMDNGTRVVGGERGFSHPRALCSALSRSKPGFFPSATSRPSRTRRRRCSRIWRRRSSSLLMQARPRARQPAVQPGRPHRAGAGPANDHYHWHIEFMPKLTKTAGFEWGTGFYINPTPPEEAAKFLREASVEDVAPSAMGAR